MKRILDAKIELMLANVKATLEIEGFVVPKEETEILRQYAKGELTEQQVLKIIRTTGAEMAKD